MTLSVLDQEQNNTPAPTAQPSGDPLAELVGEGKKFKTVEDLARGKAEADAFIARLQEEQAALRRELEARLTVEEQIARIKQAPSQPVTTPTTATSPTTSQTASLDEAAVEQLLNAKLTQREKTQRAEANKREVDAVLLKAYGGDAAKAREYVAAVEAQVGVKVADLAATSPVAAIKLLGLNERSTGLPAERSTQSTSAFGQSPQRNAAYYADLRKQMGNAKFYMDKRVQLQMHKDAQALGSAFYQ